MSTTIERTRLLAHARGVLDAAKAQNRELTEVEQAEVESTITKIKAADAESKPPSYMDQIKAISRVGPNEVNDGGVGGGFFTSEAKTGIVGAIKSRTAFRTELPAKAALTTGTLLPTSGSAVQGGLHPNQYPLAALFQNLPADGPSQRYYRFTSGTAAVVAEGALKPDSGVSIAAVDLLLAKIATTAQFSDEMADDAPFLVSHLQQELSAAVLAAENAAILATFTATSGVLTGTAATTAVVDLLADAIASAEAFSGITPAAVIANPVVVATIRKAKASTAGSYMVDPLTSGPTTIHGVQLISTPSVAAGVAWVVDPSGTVIYRRGGLTVEVGTNADDWTKNLRTMRAEERFGTAVLRPSSLTKLTLT